MKIDCPSDQVLSRYVIGDLDEADSQDVERHLAACPACEETLARFDSTEDSLMRHLPLAGAHPSQTTEPMPGWLAQLRKGPPETHSTDQESKPDVGGGPKPEFSSYELLGVLGRGGMGVVYRARHRQLNRQVALKVLSPRFLATAEARRRFEREIRILGGLHHPGIVMATDANRIGESAYLVMELVDGVDLNRMVREGGPLAISEACEAARQMASALAAAHQAGTIHRDIKPSNVMADRHGRVKLLDFGLAHLGASSTESLATSLGHLIGTLDYMAPEQADAGKPIEARADLYGLGATLFFLLTGRPPHGDHSRGSLLAQLRAFAVEDPPRVRSLRADVPQDLDDFVARLLSRDPNGRPASAENIFQALTAWAGGDLAARVAEYCVGDKAQAPASDDGDVARRSLSELLRTGFVSSTADSKSVFAVAERPKPPRRRIGRTLAVIGGAAAVGAILFGVTIFLKSPDGTLKIESETDNVSVELVNDKDQTHALKIHRGDNESTLRAGRYRVRIAGKHDGVTIDRNVITLERGGETVVRVTRLPANVKETGSEASKTAPGEPLYQGKPESEWQQVFAAETSPIAKLEAGEALLALSSERPPEQKIKRILDVGGEIVNASFGDDVIDFALAEGNHPPAGAPRWSLKKPRPVPRFRAGRFRSLPVQSEDEADIGADNYRSYLRFQERLNDGMRAIPAEALSAGLSAAVKAGSGPRGAFAAWLLRYDAGAMINKNVKASQIVLRELDTPLNGTDWSAVCLLVRSRFVNHASPPQIEQIAGPLTTFGLKLATAANTETNGLLSDDYLAVLKIPSGPIWPATLRRTAASVILDRMVRAHRGVRDFPTVNYFARETPYDKGWVADARRVAQHFLDQWLVVANPFLEKHLVPPYDSVARDVAESVRRTLFLYSDGDDWPVNKTAALLTEQLRAYYTDDRQKTTDQSVDDLLPAQPAKLLSEIMWITGEVPSYVKNGEPKARDVAMKLAQVELLKKKEGASLFQLSENPVSGLFPAAPYAVVRLAVTEMPLRLPQGYPWSLPFLSVAIPRVGMGSNDGWPAADPVLLLGLLTDFTGASQAQDTQIATIVKIMSSPNDSMQMGWGHLEKLFVGPLKAREQARRFLQKMGRNAKSPDLIDAIRKLDPTLVLPMSLPQAADRQSAPRGALGRPVRPGSP